jgi:Ser/Thr protein kinase RdoA (MazF antagonist)
LDFGVEQETMIDGYDLASVMARFDVMAAFIDAQPCCNGHINDTYVVSMEASGLRKRYLLQRINHNIMTDVPRLMDNILRVTRHLRSKLLEVPGHDSDNEALTVFLSRQGDPFLRGPGNTYWRLYNFIENATCINVVNTPDQAYEAARCVARFQRLLQDLPGPRLYESIPNFHNTPSRFDDFLESLSADKHNRAICARSAIEFALERRPMVSMLVDEQRAGSIPERITHNDAKIDNVMLNASTGVGQAVIDLDTVMPGLSLYDFGDMVRTMAFCCAEDEKDLGKVFLREELFAALTEGFLGEFRQHLNKTEMDLLVFSSRLIVFETGLRFLTDYLSGDNYFKTVRPGHNLDRAQNQFARERALERKEDDLEAIVDSIKTKQ